jgi:hypothetical protein
MQPAVPFCGHHRNTEMQPAVPFCGHHRNTEMQPAVPFCGHHRNTETQKWSTKQTKQNGTNSYKNANKVPDKNRKPINTDKHR